MAVRCKSLTLINSVVADNHANTADSGLWFGGEEGLSTSARLLHTTLVNSDELDLGTDRGSGQGVFVGPYTTLAFTNTIVAGHHSVGITATTASTVTIEATLWHNNRMDTDGAGAITIGPINAHDDPAFADPLSHDYHLRFGSAAMDAGLSAGVTTDLDGEPRPAGTRPDLGLDEVEQWGVFMPLVVRDQ